MSVPEKVDEDMLMLDDDEEGSQLKDIIMLTEEKRESALKHNRDIALDISNQISLNEVLRCQIDPFTKEQLEQDQEDLPDFKALLLTNH